MTGTIERIAWDAKSPARAARRRAAEVLERGELVVLPTETVYGVAARADSDAAIDRLRALKGRASGLALTWHVGGRRALDRFPRVSPMARRLAERYWPGPLTLVLPGVPEGLERAAQDGWTGVRLPAHAATSRLLEKLSFPVVASSANRGGEPPPSDPDAIEQQLDGEVALLLDDGPPRMGEPSVVLRIGPGHFDVLRSGLIGAQQLREVAGLRIGFVCTGNTCRSPMAEGLARDLVARRLEVEPGRTADFGFEFHSMGVLGGSGSPPSQNGIDVLRAQGIDISEHRSRPVVPQEIRALDRVYALTAGHMDSLRMLLPPGGTRNCELLDPEGRDVPDPIGGPREEYETCAERLRKALEARAQEWV